MPAKLSAYRITVIPQGSANKRIRVVLARSRAYAERMVTVYPGDRMTIATAGLVEGLLARLRYSRPPSTHELRSLYIEMRSSLRASPSFTDALRNVSTTVRNGRLADAILSAVDQTLHGTGAPKVLDCLREALPFEHVERFRAVLEVGDPVQVADDLARSSEKAVKILGQMRSAMVTPAITLVAAIGAAIFIASTQLPVMAALFKSSKAALPLPTQLLLGWVNLMKAFPPLFLAVPLLPVGAFVLLPRAYDKYPRFQDLIDRLPTIGPLLDRMRWSKTLRTLSMLLQSNVPVPRALEMAAHGTKHFRTRHFLLSVRDTIAARGDEMFVAARVHETKLGKSDSRWIDLLPLGAKTGNTGELLAKISVDYEERAEALVETLPKFVELGAMLLAGAIVGFVMIGAMLPGFRLMSALR